MNSTQARHTGQPVPDAAQRVKVALLTGGKDEPYALGLLRHLVAGGVDVVVVGGDELARRGVADVGIEFHNLVGGHDPADRSLTKVWRVFRYYGRLLVFAFRTDAELFHILWFRKFVYVERTLLNVYFRLLGKRLVFTAHNVDDQVRDGRRQTVAGQRSLRFLYRIVDHVLVHTDRMRRELIERFCVPGEKVTVVPFGINDVIPVSPVSRDAARQALGFRTDQRVLLFFGNIAPYKGVDDLVRALPALLEDDRRFTLHIAGPVRDRSCAGYWRGVEALIEGLGLAGHVRTRIGHVPDADVGLLFRAADVTVLPYRAIYQSGVLALSYAQGTPVIAADVGTLADDVIDGETGAVFKAGDVADLTRTIRRYFAQHAGDDLEARRARIRAYGAQRFSWTRNVERTRAVYEAVLGRQ